MLPPPPKEWVSFKCFQNVGTTVRSRSLLLRRENLWHHFEHPFFMLKLSCSIRRTDFLSILTISVTASIVNWRFLWNIYPTCSILSYVFDVEGRPEHGSSSISSRPSLNRLYHLETWLRNKHSSPYTCFSNAWVSVADLPNFRRNFTFTHCPFKTLNIWTTRRTETKRLEQRPTELLTIGRTD